MRNNKLFFGLIVLLLVVGAGMFVLKETPSQDVSAPVSQNDYKSIAYEIEGQTVVLKNGASVVPAAPGSASKTTTRYFENEVRADLNGDGTEDIAFLLTQDSGGSGTFFYVTAALKTQSGYRGTNAAYLGDRIAPQTTEFRNGGLIVNFAERRPGEPMTAPPSIGVSKYFTVNGDKLVEVVR